MKLDFATFIQFLFPLSEDEQLIQDCTEQMFASKVEPQHKDDICILASFRDPQIRAALHLAKFHNSSTAAKLLGALCARYFSSLTDREMILIPLPLSGARMRKRGHNQSATIAKHALKEFPFIRLRTDILRKKRDTKPQTSLEREERLKNVAGVYEVRKGKERELLNKNVILFDDVTTTGATLKAARDALMRTQPSSITCIAIAH